MNSRMRCLTEKVSSSCLPTSASRLKMLSLTVDHRPSRVCDCSFIWSAKMPLPVVRLCSASSSISKVSRPFSAIL